MTIFKKDGLFKNDRNFAIALGCIFVDGTVFFAANGHYALEVSVLYETDPLRVGLRFCITFFAAIVASLAIAVYSSVTKTVRGPIVLSFLMFVVFFVCMATATTSSSNAVWAYPIILGLGTGYSLTCLVTAAQLSAPPALISITNTAIFNSAVSKHPGADIASAVLPLSLSPKALLGFITALATNNQKTLMSIPGITGVHGLQKAYLTSFRGVWITAAVAACFFINPKKDLNVHVDAPLQED